MRWIDNDEFVDGLLRVTDGSQVNDRHMIIRMEKLCSAIASANGINPRSGWREKWDDHALKLQVDWGTCSRWDRLA